MMTICTFNARTLASEASIEDLMVQARKIRYDVIGLTLGRVTGTAASVRTRFEGLSRLPKTKCTMMTDEDEHHRPDGQTSSQSPLKSDMMLFVSLERTERIGPPWHVRGANGSIAGVRSVYPTINGNQGDQGDQGSFPWGPTFYTTCNEHE
ncbi:hypothetical protein Y032_0012g1676 [Ancylostoma ceylanicum]|uniref:Uncharacterized protein n=1 Tax=Ancylostoma ceylanicum TaxID=53326 RepID=A0A016VEC8_9BILA|nr:hypothetical protein Y032_0012g1676 [Ancylostoma ceylanicum]